MLLLLMLYQKVSSQHIPYFINNTEADGLSDNHVRCFFKDKTGYMWIGTENGLNRFDGVNYKIYRPSMNRKQYLSDEFVTSVKQDNQGDIWVTTRKGVNRIDAFTDTTEIVSHQYMEAVNLPVEITWDVLPDTDTSVWVAVDAKPLVRYNPKTKRLYPFDFKKFLSDNNIEYPPVGYRSIFRILPKSADELWLATTEGVFSFNKISAQFKLEFGLTLDEITYFKYDETTGNLWCTDEKNILYIFETKQNKITMLPLTAGSLNKFTAPYSVNHSKRIVPASDGIAFIDRRNAVVYLLAGNTSRDNYLLPGKIMTVYTDRDSITWIGSAKGVSRFVPRLNNTLHVSLPDNLLFNPEYVFENFLYNPKKDEWLITSWNSNKLFQLDNKTGVLTELPRPAAYKNDTCYSFYKKDSDTIFLLCKESLLTWLPHTNHWGKIQMPAEWKGDIVTCMTIDGDNNYWLGSRKHGIAVYSTTEKKIIQPGKEEFGSRIIHSLQYDKVHNSIWVGTYTIGLIKYDIRERKYHEIGRDDRSPYAFHSSLINDMLLDNNSDVWCATAEGGVAKYTVNSRTDSGVVHFDARKGLPGNYVYSIAFNNAGDLYYATSKGIGLINKEGTPKAFFNKECGLPYSNFQQNLISLANGSLATVVENSFICFDPLSYSQSFKCPLVIKYVLLQDSVDVLSSSQSFTHRQNSFHVSYALLDYSSAAGIEYFYQLDGFDDSWISNGKQQDIRFTGLPPGNYTLRVKASRMNSGFNEGIAEWEFTINPPWWKTWWFRTIFTMAIISVIYLFFRSRVNYLKKQQAEKIDKLQKEQAIAEKELLLSHLNHDLAITKLTALRVQMNPHFIFNSLNSIQQMVLRGEDAAATKYLSRFSKLLRTVLQQSDKTTVTLNEELETLKIYLELESLRYTDSFEYSVTVDDKIDCDETEIPTLLIQPFVENAIWHGLLHKQGKRKLCVNFSLNNKEELVCTIDDNGIGREAASKIFENDLESNSHTGKGIRSAEERLELYNQQNNTESRLEIIDKKDENGNASGTTIIVTLPEIN